MSQPIIPDVQLVDNSEQRTPLVLVLDCSGSMDGAPIQQLNQGLKLLEQELKGDAIAAKRVRLLVVKFGAVDLALTKIEEEKQRFKQAGVAYTRPWLFLMSDGQPTDAFEGAAERCRQAEKGNKVAVFPIAVGAEANQATLGTFSNRGQVVVKCLDGLKFRELFLWLSASMKVVSQSRPGGQVQLPTTDNWSNAPT
jgi:uncharacterized protein YegL